MNNKQIYKGKTLFRKTVVDNIVRIYNDPTFDFNSDWYIDASQFAKDLSNQHNVPYLKVCGIIASLSPLKSWDENKKIAVTFLKTGDARHTKLCTGKANDILNDTDPNPVDSILAILNGNKIKNFFINIAFPKDAEAVTIDRHALSICLNRSIVKEEYVGITNGQYNFFVSCYSEAGDKLGVRASMVQSITWEKWRELKKLK